MTFGRRLLRTASWSIAALAGLGLTGISAWGEALCRQVGFEGVDYTVCEADLRRHRLALFLDGGGGKPYGSLHAFSRSETGRHALFAMNAGMYHPDLAPVGLYVENGEERKSLNTRTGPGNFHLKPNGVFFVTENGAGVLDTEAYARQRPEAVFATQSGPMLVTGGKLHPRFRAGSDSLKIRNGVGMRDAHTVVFAISSARVNFHGFARLFRDELGCENALYLDGTISSLYVPGTFRIDMAMPAGPIIAAFPREP